MHSAQQGLFIIMPTIRFSGIWEQGKQSLIVTDYDDYSSKTPVVHHKNKDKKFTLSVERNFPSKAFKRDCRQLKVLKGLGEDCCVCKKNRSWFDHLNCTVIGVQGWIEDCWFQNLMLLLPTVQLSYIEISLEASPLHTTCFTYAVEIPRTCKHTLMCFFLFCYVKEIRKCVMQLFDILQWRYDLKTNKAMS